MRDELAREALAIKDQLLDALRARCAELEGERDAALATRRGVEAVLHDTVAERDAAKAEAEKLKEKWHNEQCAHCGERPEGHNGTMWCAECFEWWVRESEQECIVQLRADLDLARAGEARAVEALEAEQRAAHWRNLARITDKHEDALEASRLSEIAQRLRHGIVLVQTNNQPALDYLAQQRGEAAAEDLEKVADQEQRVADDGGNPRNILGRIRSRAAALSAEKEMGDA